LLIDDQIRRSAHRPIADLEAAIAPISTRTTHARLGFRSARIAPEKRRDAGRPIVYADDPRVIAQNGNVISINATLRIDLTGTCNSEHMLGHRHSASSGQLDFVRGAFASKRGKSVVAARSTAAQGKVSRIVARLDGPVTTPRVDTRYVVTEFGATNLKGLSSTERAHVLIGLAHSSFAMG
jgi:itaconate CoA-transferase